MNAQFAIKDDTVYVLEVNPRASRTVPYLSKATGVPLAKVAARVMIGRTLAQLGLTEDLEVAGFFVKTPVFPFVRFPGVDTILGPEMKSTGEVMGGAATFGSAFAKAQLAAGAAAADASGSAFISVNNHDKPAVVQIARDLRDLGFSLVATRGTANFLRAHGLEAEIVFKVNEGRPHVGDEILNNRIQLVINTPLGRESFFDDRTVRRIAMMHGVPCITTLTGAAATVNAIKAIRHRRTDRPRAAGIPRRNCDRPAKAQASAQNLRRSVASASPVNSVLARVGPLSCIRHALCPPCVRSPFPFLAGVGRRRPGLGDPAPISAVRIAGRRGCAARADRSDGSACGGWRRAPSAPISLVRRLAPRGRIARRPLAARVHIDPRSWQWFDATGTDRDCPAIVRRPARGRGRRPRPACR